MKKKVDDDDGTCRWSRFKAVEFGSGRLLSGCQESARMENVERGRRRGGGHDRLGGHLGQTACHQQSKTGLLRGSLMPLPTPSSLPIHFLYPSSPTKIALKLDSFIIFDY
jgi:hypothetical protein